MQLILEFAFGASLTLLIWTYLGYPCLIFFLGKCFPFPVKSGDHLPSVSIVLAVRNEEKTIVRKVKNLMELSYPKDKIELIIIDDCSSDRTAFCLQEFPGILTQTLDSSCGKALALNHGIKMSTGDLIMFCDARQMIAPDALTHLVPLFSDPTIGGVSGELQMPQQEGPGLYWRYERSIRKFESLFSSVVGATGALYVVRRSLCPILPPKCLLDDVFIPLAIHLKGYRILFCPSAKAFDVEAKLTQEFQRKIRTLTGNFQLIELLPALLNPFKNAIFFQFLSHKIGRLLCPYALMIAFLSNGLLVMTSERFLSFFQFFFLIQIFCYSMAAIDYLTESRFGPFAKLSRTFLVLNLAAIIALKRYITRNFSWT